MGTKVTKPNILLILAILVLISYIWITNKRYEHTIDTKYKTEIDSLNKAISGYQQHQIILNKKISDKELIIKELDHEIDSAKQAIIQERKYYGEKIKNAGRYTPTELNSFFSERYN